MNLETAIGKLTLIQPFFAHIKREDWNDNVFIFIANPSKMIYNGNYNNDILKLVKGTYFPKADIYNLWSFNVPWEPAIEDYNYQWLLKLHQ